jgi:hypothetical protein
LKPASAFASVEPVSTEKADEQTAKVRKGDRALYYWIYPNLMINWYEGVMDTNVVRPLGIDRTEVVFDFTSRMFPSLREESPGEHCGERAYSG